MVKSTTTTTNNNNNTTNGSKVIVTPLDTTTKPPGTSRFSRSRNDFEKETKQVDTTEKNALVANRGNALETELQLESDICKQLLVNGYVQSYIDFYHLTNRADPLADPTKEIPKIRTSIDHMLFIRDKLLASENARRRGNTNGVYVAYNELADSFAKKQDWRTSIFFHEKRLEVAQIISDDKAVMSANQSLGLVHQQIGEYEIARKFHEKQEELASKYDLVEDIARAHAELYKVYMILATNLEHDGNNTDALDMYKKCLSSAIKSWNKPAEGVANGKIGNLLLSQGMAKDSISYLRTESKIATEMSDADGRCKASSSLAFAFDILGEAEKALEELTLVHTISEQAGDAVLQANACKALGTLYSKVGKFELASQCFQKHFLLVKRLVGKQRGNENQEFTSRDLDLARVYVGISKGNHMMGSYIYAIQSDFDSLLSWKLSRTELSSDPFKPKDVQQIENINEENIKEEVKVEDTNTTDEIIEQQDNQIIEQQPTDNNNNNNNNNNTITENNNNTNNT